MIHVTMSVILFNLFSYSFINLVDYQPTLWFTIESLSERNTVMTIKEIELRSGMDRANIRFYEKEGLLSPRYLDNGYRDYTEDD